MMTSVRSEARAGLVALLRTLVALGDLIYDGEDFEVQRRWLANRSRLHKDGWI